VSARAKIASAITPEQLAVLLPDYLARQRWFAGDEPPRAVEMVAFDVLEDGDPGMVWALARVPGDDACYQVVVGLRPLLQTERFLEGKGRGMLGDIEIDGEREALLAYDALVDPDLARLFLKVVAPDEDATLVRPLLVEQSNTSVVYDDRLILKLFRRVHDGPNPDRELSESLEAAGWSGVPRTYGTWSGDDRDLAVVRQYVPGGTDGWHLALTSLRDLFDAGLAPNETGGDFGPDAHRLGALAAEMHVALAEVLGSSPADPADWLAAMGEELRRVEHVDTLDTGRIEQAFERLRDVQEPGHSVRIHGDLHLGQVLRGDAGWFILDFEGEPRVPLAERRKPTSPLRDVAGMLRSFQYVATVGLRERGDEDVAEMVELSQAWQARNRKAFVDGYLSVEAVLPLLPGEGDRALVLDTFELAKAMYEVEYEAAHRPDWIDIPMSAIEALLP
jgi:maltokinase